MKRALLVGTFDPPSVGHLDMIERSASLFAELIVGIAINPVKKTLFTTQERQKLLEDLTRSLPNVSIEIFEGLTVDFARQEKVDVLVRGLRTFADLDRELQLAIMNKKLGGIETVILPSNPLYAHISSSLIRELAYHRASLDGLVPKVIAKKVLKRLNS